jgi:hypothetical protein
VRGRKAEERVSGSAGKGRRFASATNGDNEWFNTNSKRGKAGSGDSDMPALLPLPPATLLAGNKSHQELNRIAHLLRTNHTQNRTHPNNTPTW